MDQALGCKDGGRDNIAPMLWKAKILYKKGKYGDALTWYKRALRAFPSARHRFVWASERASTSWVTLRLRNSRLRECSNWTIRTLRPCSV